MLFKQFKIVTLLFALINLPACMSEKYVEFKVITEDSENRYFENEITDSVFFENVQIVLKTYNIDFKIKNGKILIPTSTYQDKEFCKNISIKASDSEWIESNKE